MSEFGHDNLMSEFDERHNHEGGYIEPRIVYKSASTDVKAEWMDGGDSVTVNSYLNSYA